MIRLSKLMSERGICSRREADRYIERGLVLVNGEPITELGTKVELDVEIELTRRDKTTTIILNKPIGYVSCQPEKGYTPAIKLLPNRLRNGLAVVGRLDIDSTGLLLFTSDGRLAKEIIGENTEVEKEYLVRVEGELEDLSILNHGLSLDGQKLKPATVEWASPKTLRFVLRQGRKRQIRRMCEQVGLKVTSLKRIRIGSITLDDLKEGEWKLIGEHRRK